MKILIIEDEISLLEIVSAFLTGEGYLCETATDFGQADEKIALFEYDLVLLDLTLPGGNGMDLLPAIRLKQPIPGVIILTARNSLDDKIMGLDLGADDYLTKPFHLSELNSRIRAFLRRNRFDGHDSIAFNDLLLHLDSKEVYVGDKMIPLTKKEYDLLLYFVTNQNRVLTRAAISEHLWGDSIDQADNFDLIYAHVKNLRRKIEGVGGMNPIQTVYGLGYRIKRL